MAWSKTAVTNDGTEMLNELLAGRRLTLTSAWAGTETVNENVLNEQHDVSGEKHKIVLVNVTNASQGKTVRVQINNQGLTEQYTAKQIGVYAQVDKGLPTESEEKLLCILQDERGADVPTQADNPIFLLNVYALVAITNEVRFEVEVDAAGLVAIEVLENTMQAHNADEDAHPDLRAKIAGMGGEEYSTEKAYSVGDYCTHEGTMHRCIAAVEAGTEWTPESWQATNVTDELKAARSGGGEEYSTEKAYVVGDYCTHDGAMYRCVAAVEAGTEWTPESWQATSVTEELKAARNGVGEEYTTEKAYTVGDYCTHEGKMYRCVAAVAAGTEWTPESWEETTTAKELKEAKASAESFAPKIAVSTYPGATVTATNGTDTVTGEAPDGTCTLTVTGFGTWTASAVLGGQNVGTRDVEITNASLYRVNLKFRRYGYRVKKSESGKRTRIELLYDAVGMRSAGMNYAQDRFDYGDWADVWFIKKNFPCMLRYDGTVGYKLNPNKYSEKEDGSASDVANTAYGGNAMSAIPLCWTKRYEENGWGYFIVCEEQYDETYKAEAHTDAAGNIKEYAYGPMFKGSLIDGKLRSLSGQRPDNNRTAEAEVASAVANGAGWNIRYRSLDHLVADLATLIAATEDSQEAYGHGHTDGGSSASNLLTTGSLNDKGQFYGTNTNAACKLFHMENFYADRWDRELGTILDNGVYKVKMTPENGGYNLTGAGYITVPTTTLTGTSGGYIIDSKFSEYGRLPQGSISGSDATYECDGCWFNNSILAVAVVGGNCDNGSRCGLRSLAVADAASHAAWDFGASLSYV